MLARLRVRRRLSCTAAAAAAAAAGPAAFWKPLVLDTVVLRRCRVRVCVPHGGGAPSGASVHRNGYRDERDDGARARELARRAGAAHAATPPQPLPARAERPLRGPRQRRRAAAAAAAAAAADIVDRMPRGHGLLRPRRAHHPAADGRTLAAPAHRCLAPLGRARGALRRVPVHADDGGPRAVAAPSGALVGSRRLWYSMLNVPVFPSDVRSVLKFRAATSTLPKHEDTRGSNISKITPRRSTRPSVLSLSVSLLQFYSPHSGLSRITLPAAAQKARTSGGTCAPLLGGWRWPCS